MDIINKKIQNVDIIIFIQKYVYVQTGQLCQELFKILIYTKSIPHICSRLEFVRNVNLQYNIIFYLFAELE